MAGRNVRDQSLSSSAETNLRANTPTAGRVLGTPPHLKGRILKKCEATIEGETLWPSERRPEERQLEPRQSDSVSSRPHLSETHMRVEGWAQASCQFSQTSGPRTEPSDVVGDELGSAGSRTPPRARQRAVANGNERLFERRRTPASSSDTGFERDGPVINPLMGGEGLSDYEARVGVGNIDERVSRIEFGSDVSVSSGAKRARGARDRHGGSGGAS